MEAVHDRSRDGESQRGTILPIIIGFACLSPIVTSARFYTRIFLLRYFGPDDATMVAAQICAVIFMILQCIQVRLGVGSHIWTIPPETALQGTKVFFAAIVIYNLGMNIVKLSFLLFYRRVFPENHVTKLCASLLIFVGLWTITQILILTLSCMPLTAIVPSMRGRCLDTMPVWYFSAAMSIATDFVILLVPLPSVAKLILPVKQKVGVFAIFGLGFFACIISIIRIFTLKKAVETTDPTYDLCGVAMWTAVELNISIITASLPTLRPLLRHVSGAYSSTFSGNSYQMSGFSSSMPQSSKPQKLKNQGSRDGDGAHYLDQNSSTERLRNAPSTRPGACSSGVSLAADQPIGIEEA